MKRFLLVFLAMIALAGCTKVIAPVTPDVPLYVYDSSWNRVPESAFVKTIAKAIDLTVSDVASAVAEYNASTTTDFWHIETEEVAIADAPEATVVIASDADMTRLLDLKVDRVSFAANRASWELSAEVMSDPITGELIPCTLYVDRVPPTAPIPLEPRLWVALVNVTDHIVIISEHYDTQAQASARIVSLQTQVEMENLGYGSYPIGTEWQVYNGLTEFAW